MLSSSGEAYPDEERTIIDAGREWIERYAAQHPELKAALKDGAVEKRAHQLVAQWSRASLACADDLRRSTSISAQMTVSQLHRASTNIVRAFMTKHDTFATFLSEPLDGLQRWQSALCVVHCMHDGFCVRVADPTLLPCIVFCIIMTLVIQGLMVNIWMFYDKADNCCRTVRGLLNSGPDGGACPVEVYTAPCRGYVGECGALPTQFATVAVLPDYPNGLQDWQCTAFPNDDRPLDSLLVALISAAIAIPVTAFVASCFEVANDSEAPESWLVWEGPLKILFGTNAHRKWHYTRGKQPMFFVRWHIRSADATTIERIINAWHILRSCLVPNAEPPWARKTREAAQPPAEATSGEHPGGGADADETSSVRSALALMKRKRFIMALGIVSLALCWVIFSWFIFVRAPQHGASLLL